MLNKLKQLLYYFTPVELRQRARYRELLKNRIFIDPFVEIQDSKIEPSVWLVRYSHIINSTIGRYSSIGRNSILYYVDMGSFCSISWNVTIGAVNHPYRTPTTHSFPFFAQLGLVDKSDLDQTRTVVGHDVWIGCNSVIMPGITIGNGAVVGAGAVVTMDVPEYALVAGVPARVIDFRFDRHLRERLAAVQWWDFPEEILRQNVALFRKEVTEEVLDRMERLKRDGSRPGVNGGRKIKD